MAEELALTLYEVAETQDGVVHLDLADMKYLGVVSGDIIAVEGARRAYLQIMPAYMGDRNQRLARVSPLTARNLGHQSGQRVRLLPERMKIPFAERVTLQTSEDVDYLHLTARKRQIGTYCAKRVVSAQDDLEIPTLDAFPLLAKVVSVLPDGAAQIGHTTAFVIERAVENQAELITGGLRSVYFTCKKLARARLSHGLGAAARSVLLQGAAGCGKALMVGQLARAMGVELHTIDLYHLIDKWMLHGGTGLEDTLSELDRRGQSFLLLDHLEALFDAPSPAAASAIYALTAQLCALLDELPTRPNVFVFGVTRSAIPVASRLSGLFDHMIRVDVPNSWGRGEVLHLATRKLSLENDADLDALSDVTAGMTAREIAAFVASASYLSTASKLSIKDFTAALRSCSPTPSGEILCDIPKETWDEIAGLDDIKQLLSETLAWSLYDQDKFVAAGVKPPRSILLSGGQGTGKTSAVRALAAHMPMNFVEIACPVIIAKYPADSARLLLDSFAMARRKAPCLLFFDDIDALFETTAVDPDAEPHFHPVVAQLLAELDALPLLSGVMVFAATNRPDRLTSEILRPGRFDFAVTFPMPDNIARKKILQIHARKMPLSSDIDFDRLASNTQGMSPAEIANLCNRVGLMALRQALANPEGGVLPIVTPEHFEQALRGRKS